MTITKTEKLINALNNGVALTSAQIQHRFGFLSESAVSSAIRSLREAGHSIYTNTNASGVTKYRVGAPRRRVVAAGYAVLGAKEAFGG